jgi:hypothetical protein
LSLRRAADPASLNAFAAALQNGSREDDIILALVASNEYFLRP